MDCQCSQQTPLPTKSPNLASSKLIFNKALAYPEASDKSKAEGHNLLTLGPNTIVSVNLEENQAKKQNTTKTELDINLNIILVNCRRKCKLSTSNPEVL